MYQLVVHVRALAWAQVYVCWWYAFMCAHPRKCIMRHIAWVSLVPLRVCLWVKVYTKLYRGNSFIHHSNNTPHLTFKGGEIAAWFWLIVDFKALHKAKQCWHTVLTAAGSEKLSGMSGHTKCILTQAIPIRCFVSLMKPRWCVTSVRAWLCWKSKSSQSDQSINSDQRAVSHKTATHEDPGVAWWSIDMTSDPHATFRKSRKHANISSSICLLQGRRLLLLLRGRGFPWLKTTAAIQPFWLAAWWASSFCSWLW